MTKFERTDCEDVTATLIKAMERAGKMRCVMVIYETHADNEDSSGGIITQPDVTVQQLNWMLDMGKNWLFS